MSSRAIKVSDRFYSYLKTIMKETGIQYYSEAADIILDRAKDFHSKKIEKQLNDMVDKAVRKYFSEGKFKVTMTKEGFVSLEFS